MTNENRTKGVELVLYCLQECGGSSTVTTVQREKSYNYQRIQVNGGIFQNKLQIEKKCLIIVLSYLTTLKTMKRRELQNIQQLP